MASPSIHLRAVDSLNNHAHADKFAQRAFFGVLAVVTLLPLVWLGFGMGLLHQDKTRTLIALAPIIAVTSIGHVGSTAFFYLDQSFFSLIRLNAQRFFLWPVLTISLCLAVISASSTAWLLLLAAYGVWQLYHYQRQNYGIIAFAAQSARVRNLPAELNWMLDLGVAGGACNLLRDTFLKALWASAIAYDLSVVLFLASTVMLVKILLQASELRASLNILLFTVLGWAFFLPTLIRNDALVSFWSYGIAHGAQYLVFMIVISGNRQRGALGLCIFGMTLVVSLVLFRDRFTSQTVTAVFTGVVMAHFLIDAKLWRLREPLQRQIVGERFGFIFP